MVRRKGNEQGPDAPERFDVSEEELAALALGALDPGKERALQAQIAADPKLQERFEEKKKLVNASYEKANEESAKESPERKAARNYRDYLMMYIAWIIDNDPAIVTEQKKNKKQISLNALRYLKENNSQENIHKTLQELFPTYTLPTAEMRAAEHDDPWKTIARLEASSNSLDNTVLARIARENAEKFEETMKRFNAARAARMRDGGNKGGT